MIRLLLTCLGCLLFAGGTFAQGEVGVKVYEFEDGLSHRIVFKITQDEQGYIWLATINGLNRFDGYNFVHYHPNEKTTYLPHSAYSDMALGPDGALWLGSPNFVTHFYPSDADFEDFKIKKGPLAIRQAKVPHNMTFGPKGQLWIAVYNEQTAQTELLCMQQDGTYRTVSTLDGQYTGRPMAIVEDRLLLGANGNELWEITPGGKIAQKYKVPIDTKARLSDIAVQGQLIYLLCVSGQVLTLDRTAQSFAEHPATFETDMAATIKAEANGNLWLGGRGVLLYYDSKTGSMTNYDPQVREITKNVCTYRQIFRDRSGVVWVASDFGAVKIVQSEQLFDHYLEGGSEYCSNVYCSTRGITEDELGRIYISYYNSIHQLDPTTNSIRPLFPYDNYFNNPFGLTYFKGALWTGNGKRIDLRSLSVEKILPHTEKDLGHVIPDRDSLLWMGYMHWLYQYDTETKKLVEYEDQYGKWDSLDGNISYLHQGRTEAWIWVGTLNNGLYKIKKGRGRMAHYYSGKDSPLPFANDQINAIYEDQQKRLWVGTGSGLHRIDLRTDSLRIYTAKDGLPNDFINGILPEGDSCLWISTDNGLSRFSIAQQQFNNFSVEDGITANEFNRISFYKSRAGRLYFGGLNGLNAFFPGDQFTTHQEDEQELPILLTEYSKYDGVNDTLITQTKGLNQLEAIVISPWDRIFSFRFALADFRHPLENLYSFQLEGYDEEWSPVSETTLARYNNIPAGQYTFRVRSKSGANTALWNSKELAIPIIVQEAFYNTWWFWVLCTFFLSGIVFSIMRYRIYLARKREAALQELVRARTKELEIEKQKSEELLLNILPAETAEELKQFGAAKAKRHELVTVMFSDFKGFSRISEQMDPEDLVAEIDHCFRAFDEIMEKYGLEKIKTVGDAYLSVGGMRDDEGNEAVRVTLAALEIQEFMAGLRLQREAENKPYFEARIGIHTGPVVAGIVGIKKFAYDIWGDTVNLAARMETSGEAGRVNISETTQKLINDLFECTHHGQYTERGGSDIDMYFVDRYTGD
jgi:class 3 adenylate cyclase/ligand-binding sensor domain-containing protein